MQSQSRCLCIKCLHLFQIQHSRNQQHGICTNDSCFINLIRIDDKILPQNRKLHSLPDGTQILTAALKVVLLRQAGNGICSGCLIGNRLLNRMKVCTNNRFRRGRFLHFRNNGKSAILQSMIEIQNRTGFCFCQTTHFRSRYSSLFPCQLFPAITCNII